MVEIKVLVQGGKATAGPPLGPALGPLGVNIGKVVAEINKATAKYEGLTVPVTVIVDPVTKDVKVEVGVPPTSALIKKELGIEKGSGEPGRNIVGDLPLEKVIEIAKIKMEQSNARDLRSMVKVVLGTCLSMGVTVNGMNPREVIRKIESGEIEIPADR